MKYNRTIRIRVSEVELDKLKSIQLKELERGKKPNLSSQIRELILTKIV